MMACATEFSLLDRDLIVCEGLPDIFRIESEAVPLNSGFLTVVAGSKI